VDDQRGEPGRHAGGDPEELQQELAGVERQSGQDEHAPADPRARQDEGRQTGDEEAKRRELGRREAVETDPRGDECEPPEHGDEEAERGVDPAHGRFRIPIS
jgi:hypothetical protein